MKHTLKNRRKYCDSIIVRHATRVRWALHASYGRLIVEIDPILPDTPSTSDEHQCTTTVQGGALRYSNLYFCADQLKLSTLVCKNA